MHWQTLPIVQKGTQQEISCIISQTHVKRETLRGVPLRHQLVWFVNWVKLTKLTTMPRDAAVSTLLEVYVYTGRGAVSTERRANAF
jgi:hypothetical protein